MGRVLRQVARFDVDEISDVHGCDRGPVLEGV